MCGRHCKARLEGLIELVDSPEWIVPLQTAGRGAERITFAIYPYSPMYKKKNSLLVENERSRRLARTRCVEPAQLSPSHDREQW